MGRNMLKWRSRRRYRLRDTPYAPLVESPDHTNAGNMNQRLKTTTLENIRLSDKSEATVVRRTMIDARNSKTDVNPNTEAWDFEQASFVKIPSEELNLEDSDPESEQTQRIKRNAFRRFSDSSMASVAKMSNKWSKIRDSFIPVGKSSTLPEVISKSGGTRKRELKPGAATSTSGKNPLQWSSLRNRQRLWSLYPTYYVKLNNSDSSPSMAFDLEDIAHSTFIQGCKDTQADKHNRGIVLEFPTAAQQQPSPPPPPVGEKVITDKRLGCIPKHQGYTYEVRRKQSLHKSKRSVRNAKKRAVRKSAGPNIHSERNIQRKTTKRLQGSSETTRLPNNRRKDSYSLKTLSVKSSEGKVEVKISLELSDSIKKHKNSSGSRSGVTNKYYLRSPHQTIITTPVRPKRPLSRRSLFSDKSNHGESIAVGDNEGTSDNKGRWNDSSSVSELNTEHSSQDKSLHLSPFIGETDHIITPPNKQELTVSIEQIGKLRPRRVRKPRGMRC